MATQFPIPRGSSAVVLNDMINSNLRTGRAEHDAAIEASGIVANTVRLVTMARERDIPIVWIRVERRPDRADVFDAITDVYIANGCKPKPPVVAGSTEAANVDELPVLDQDHVILKPRIDPFIATDLDLRLRSLGVDTILLGGYSTNSGVESIARSANGRNYHVVTLKDCCYNIDKEAHEFSITKMMPRVARVMTVDDAFKLIR